jgi:hypothetical protein
MGDGDLRLIKAPYPRRQPQDMRIPVHRGQSFRRIADSIPMTAESS